MEHAKGGPRRCRLAVVSGGLRRGAALPRPQDCGARACANAQAVLRLIGRLVQDRTAAQWQVVDVLRSVQHGHSGTHGTQKIAAQELGITEQSVSRAVLRSGWQEEWAARPAAAMLLAFAHEAITGTGDAGEQPAGQRPGRGRGPAPGFPPPGHYRRRPVNALWITLALLTAGFAGWPVTALVFRLARTIDDRADAGDGHADPAEDPAADVTVDP